jgi:hypothetical protein
MNRVEKGIKEFRLQSHNSSKLLLYLLAKASWASMAVFLPRKAGGLTDLLRLFLRTFSLFFFRSLEGK